MFQFGFSDIVPHLAGCACGECLAGPARLDGNVDGQGGTIDGKPVWTATAAAAQLNRAAFPEVTDAGPGWSNDGLDARPASGDPSLLLFGFHSQATMDASFYASVAGMAEYPGFQPFSAAQEAAARKAIQLWNDLIAIDIVEVAADQADITFGNYDNQAGTQAYAFLPYNYAPPATEFAGDVWINVEQGDNLELDNGDYGLHVLVHETGHSLGLMHPGDYDAGDGGPISYTNSAEYYQDSRQYTLMSYFNAEFTGAGHVDWSRFVWVYGQTPLLHDILAIQTIYGADTTTRTGGTVYGFNSDAGRDVFDFTLNTMPVISINDAGGIDTLDFSGWDTPSTIDLNPGAFSSGGGSGVVPLADLKAAGYLPPDYSQAEYDALRAAYNALDGLLHDNISIAYGTIIENAIGGGGDDTIIGNADGNILVGNSGNDSLFGGDGDDILIGGLGDDLLDGGAGNDTVSYADIAGEVRVQLLTVGPQVRRAGGSDTLASIENVIAGAGNDSIWGANDANRLEGGAGNDRLFGLRGDDILVGGDGADQLDGSYDHDLLEGGTGNDLLVGGAGDDILLGGLGDDLLDGGEGNDTVSYADIAGEVRVQLLNGGPQVRRAGGSDTLASIENVIAGAGNDSIWGTNDANRLEGGAGNDRLFGLRGDDILLGGDGDDQLDGSYDNDLLIGGLGDDLLDGGAGNDTVSYADIAGEVRVQLLQGGPQVARAGGSDTLASIENVIAGAGNDSIWGTNAANRLEGGAGNDRLFGLRGNDILLGGDGYDLLDGSYDNDLLEGGNGNDLLEGGAGFDWFVFERTLNAVTNVDHILDFAVGVDKIVLENALFAGLAAGALAAGAFKAGTAATDASDRIIYNPTTGALLFDTDGWGAAAAVHFATLDNLPANLAASDFLVI